MGYSSFLSFSLGFLLLFHCSFAQIEQVVNSQERQQENAWTQCQIQNLNALECKRRIEFEAGVTGFWDQNEEQLQCANVAVFRHTIQSRGLLVPSYNNAPELVYVVAFMECIPSCLRHSKKNHITVHDHKTQDRKESAIGRTKHQKVGHIREDVGNSENQLDQYLRKFVLGGSLQQESQGGGQSWGRSRSQSQSQSSRRGQQEKQSNNILSAFDEEILAQSFNIDTRQPEDCRKRRGREALLSEFRRTLRYYHHTDKNKNKKKNKKKKESEDREMV
ncbi:hypothetical protein Patl1_25602 [Pistacia atlantica]|uniref:Uncharacterized protein n=1 Tax=Pistacia atlantica TaxID=434234 RepID=A0ACC1AZK1_9ROSI|nr:hypothetical protein Patl1_25602 [Pistacia atlantica]